MSRKKIEKGMAELIPIGDYDDQLDCILCQDDSLLDLYQINTRDLTSSNIEAIEADCFTWGKFYRLYAEDIKFVFLKFPCNTQSQQGYWLRRMEKNRNPLYADMLSQKYEDLVYREKHTSSMEFYLMIFAKDKEKLLDQRHQINALLQVGRHGLLSRLQKKKKLQILFKLGNKSSLIL